MSDNNNNTSNQGGSSRLGSFAGTHPDFKDDVPDSFKNAPDMTRDFDKARDPFIRAQIEDLQKTESERRGSGGGWWIIWKKTDKAQPKLKLDPPYIPAMGRDEFNHTWLQHQRNARIKILHEQHKNEKRQEQSHTHQPKL